MSHPARWLAILVLWGCAEPSAAPPAPAEEVAVAPAQADAARGHERMAELQCQRCHEGTALPVVSQAQRCVGCHQDILGGDFDAPPASVRAWRHTLVSLNHAPALDRLGARLRPDWIARFLRRPHDVRPGLPATMPRLPMTEEDARDIAAALTEDAAPLASPPPTEESVPTGLALIEGRGCLGCHRFSQVRESTPTMGGAAEALAPDLRHTRERMSEAMLLRWLEDPSAVHPGTLMPSPALEEAERRAVANALLNAPLQATSPPRVPERLPVLERPVRFAEVSERVFSRTCWHCHADPDFARGDGGAGNTGGFGYPGRGVNLMDYAGVSSGYLDTEGERRSMFADDDGTPHLVRVLMARHAEEAGSFDDAVTGMPLGLPPVSLEEIQLVETWIAQGRPN
ncbi:MAG: cytochrome C oxidase Cbb3 [Sandaracinaceae bacterium]